MHHFLIFRHIKATDNDNKAKAQWEFDFSQGKPMRLTKDYKWEAVPCDEVPKVYSVTHVKRLRSHNTNFEGQLPKLRYYHHIKKVEQLEENNNQISVKTQPITASAKKNEISGQMKITGKLQLSETSVQLINFRNRFLLNFFFLFFSPFFQLFRFPQREETSHRYEKETMLMLKLPSSGNHCE